MTDSLSSWLALREPADHAARSASGIKALAERLPRDTPVHVIDLATGSGSNLRFLAGHLPPQQRWLLVDRDGEILQEIPGRMSSWGTARGYEVSVATHRFALRGAQLDCEGETRQLDLGGLHDSSIFDGRHLVTASALLDLVSEDWLRALTGQCRRVATAVLFALTYTGKSRCSPVEPEDDIIRGLFNEHQRSNNKGFGPAVGPDGTDCATRCLTEAGYQVHRFASDWVLPPDTHELQQPLIEGWARAAEEIAPAKSTMIHRWLRRRLVHLAGNRSRVVVGHEDLVAWLPIN